MLNRSLTVVTVVAGVFGVSLGVSLLASCGGTRPEESEAQRPAAAPTSPLSAVQTPTSPLSAVQTPASSASAMQASASGSPATPPTLVERGAYLVNALGCDDCHSAKIFTDRGPIPDPTRRMSGHPASEVVPSIPDGVLTATGWGALASNSLTAWAGPWGVSFASNITPHETGIAAWTEQQFIDTIRHGKHLGVARDLLPPMPWPYYARLTDVDLKAIFAFLKALPPVNNSVPDPIPPGKKALTM